MQIAFISGALIGLLFYTFLAWKINVRLRLGIYSGLTLGSLTGLIGYGLNLSLSLPMLLLAQACLLAAIGVTVMAIRFYRDPERSVPDGDVGILSPADGTVRYIRRLQHGEIPFSEKKGRVMELQELTRTDLLESTGWIIGIEMSVLDVHVNRAPVDGKVIYQARHPGPFLSLRTLDAVAQNERRTTVFQCGQYKVAMIQIASRLVRRIVSYIQTGDDITAGQRVGMIKFGSQVDVVLPELPGLDFVVKEGQHVLAGHDILARWQDN